MPGCDAHIITYNAFRQTTAELQQLHSRLHQNSMGVSVIIQGSTKPPQMSCCCCCCRTYLARCSNASTDSNTCPVCCGYNVYLCNNCRTCFLPGHWPSGGKPARSCWALACHTCRHCAAHARQHASVATQSPAFSTSPALSTC